MTVAAARGLLRPLVRVARAPILVAVLSAWIAAGCRGEPVRVDLGALEGALFFVVLGHEGELRGIEGPLVVRSGVRAAGTRPERVLSAEEAELLVLAVPLDEVAEAVPGFEAQEAPRLSLRTSAEAAEDTPERWWRALPRETTVWRVEEASGALVPSQLPEAPILSLGVPRDPEHCRPAAWSPLAPYAATLAPLPAPDPELVSRHRWPKVVALDEGRVAVRQRDLAIVLRSTPFVPRSGPGSNVLVASEVASPGTSHATFVDFAVDPRPLPEGGRRLWILSQAWLRDGHETALHEAHVAGDALTLVGSRVLGPDIFDGLDVSPEGELALAARGGPISLLRPGSEGPEPLPPLTVEPAERLTTRVLWTGYPRESLLVATESRLHLYAPHTDRWIPTDLRVFVDMQVPIAALAAVPASEELWAGGGRGALYHRRGRQPWEKLALTLPPRAAACRIDDGTGGSESLPLLAGLEPREELLFAAPRDCSALLAVRRSDLCVALIPRQDGIRVLEPEEIQVGLTGTARQLVVVTFDGALYLSEREP